MITALLLAGGIANPSPQAPLQGGPFAEPRLFTMSFQEAIRVPDLRRPEPLPLALEPLQRPASHMWMRFALEFMAGGSFVQWEQDPGKARRTQGQPPSSWVHFAAPRP